MAKRVNVGEVAMMWMREKGVHTKKEGLVHRGHMG